MPSTAWRPSGRRPRALLASGPEAGSGASVRTDSLGRPGTAANSRTPVPTVIAVQFGSDTLAIEFRDVPPAPVRLAGPREVVEAVAARDDATGTRVEFPLVGPRWGVDGLSLPTGQYRLETGDAAGVRVELEPDALPALRHALFRCELEVDPHGLTAHINPPLARKERLPIPHRDHRRVYLRGRSRPEDAVYFESFYGRSASCNPAGIDRVLAAVRPDITRYWSVSDGSKPVPEGAVRIIEGSSEWWRVRAEARVYVINDWLRWTFFRRPYQHVLQTWHGTMLKRLALDRDDVTLRRRSAVIRQQARWDALLSQNPYSSAIFRRSYAVRCPIWETGYPRNDVFADAQRARVVRRALGISEGVRVVMYAPTWRDDRLDLVDHLDLPALADHLPPDHVLLIRGHSRTLAHGGDVRGRRMLDVTSYPDMSDLMTVTDVLVTDYSSTMFDFAATGKPMIFFTPDIAHYADNLRGFYFDLLEAPPGPVVTTQPDLLDAIGGIDALAREHAAAYQAWRSRFVPFDDGRAGERAVQQILDQGWLP